MKLVAMLTEPRSIARFLAALGEPKGVARRPPLTQPGAAHWKSTVLRCNALVDAA